MFELERINDVRYQVEVLDGQLRAAWWIRNPVTGTVPLLPFHELRRVCPLTDVRLEDDEWTQVLGEIVALAVATDLVPQLKSPLACLRCKKPLMISNHAFVCQDLCMRFSPGYSNVSKFKDRFPQLVQTSVLDKDFQKKIRRKRKSVSKKRKPLDGQISLFDTNSADGVYSDDQG